MRSPNVHTSIFFSALAQALQSSAHEGISTVNPGLWSKALTIALERLYTYTRARPPSRTLVDPLQAFVETADGQNLLAGYKRAANILRIEEKKDGRAYDGAVEPALVAKTPPKPAPAKPQVSKSAEPPAPRIPAAEPIRTDLEVFRF